MLESVVCCANNLWNKFLDSITVFFYGFLSDDQLAEIQARAEQEILDSTIRQRRILNEMEELLWQRYEEDGYEEEEIKSMVEEEIKSIIERK